jgi:hypothetical protein
MTGTDWLEVYRASLYAVPAAPGTAGPWLGFRLDGDPEAALPQELAAALGVASSATLLTAWNPDSVECEAAANEAANRDLEARMKEAGWEVAPAFGASLPGTHPAWQEDGFLVRGWGLEQALSWAFCARQRAVVHWTAAGIGLLFRNTGSFHPCGAVLVEDDARLLEHQVGG